MVSDLRMTYGVGVIRLWRVSWGKSQHRGAGCLLTPWGTYLVEEDTGYLAVQGRLEGKVQVEREPGGGGGGALFELPGRVQVVEERAV